MINSPLVSVIINCHNGEKYLEECLKSVLLQNYKNWEIIFWDNLSTDKSKSIVNSFSDKRIKYFYSNKFLNLYHARNLAIAQASGKYISFLDVDDFWEKEKIESQVIFLENNQDIKMVYSNFYLFDQFKKKKISRYKNYLPHGKITDQLLKNYSIGILTVCVHKKIFEKFVFEPKYNVIGDFDLFIKISREISIGCIQEPLANYRIHDNNFSKKKKHVHIKELKSWIKEKESEFSAAGFSLFNQKIFLYKLVLKDFINRFLGV